MQLEMLQMQQVILLLILIYIQYQRLNQLRMILFYFDLALNIPLFKRPAAATSSLSTGAKVAIGAVVSMVVLGAVLGPALYYGLNGKNCILDIG